jgi:aldehyde:ferredoxin oxidoreductase
MDLDREVDCLPPKFTEEPLNSGAPKGEKVDRARFENMLNEYYT